MHIKAGFESLEWILKEEEKQPEEEESSVPDVYWHQIQAAYESLRMILLEENKIPREAVVSEEEQEPEPVAEPEWVKDSDPNNVILIWLESDRNRKNGKGTGNRTRTPKLPRGKRDNDFPVSGFQSRKTSSKDTDFPAFPNRSAEGTGVKPGAYQKDPQHMMPKPFQEMVMINIVS